MGAMGAPEANRVPFLRRVNRLAPGFWNWADEKENKRESSELPLDVSRHGWLHGAPSTTSATSRTALAPARHLLIDCKCF